MQQAVHHCLTFDILPRFPITSDFSFLLCSNNPLCSLGLVGYCLYPRCPTTIIIIIIINIIICVSLKICPVLLRNPEYGLLTKYLLGVASGKNKMSA
jgi:hypothetical protein